MQNAIVLINEKPPLLEYTCTLYTFGVSQFSKNSIWNILHIAKFYRGSPLNHAESFIEALYCV